MLRVEVANEVRGGMADATVERVISRVIARSPDHVGTTRQSRPRKNSPRGNRPGLLHSVRNDRSISIAFIGPKRMRELNKTYHGEDRVTDVLAFSELESQKARKPESRMARQLSSFPAFQLGEILICPSYVRTQAKRAGESFQRELARVLVHGTLHLLGYDHATPRQAEKMFGLQEQIVKTLKSKP